MKVRVTLMTENDKHFDITDEEAREVVEKGWNFIVKVLEQFSEDPSEKVTVESVEVVEK